MAQSLWSSSAERHRHPEKEVIDGASSMLAELSVAMGDLKRTAETAHPEALQPLAVPAAAMVREQVAPVTAITEAPSYRAPVEPTPASAENFPEQAFAQTASVTNSTGAPSYQAPVEQTTGADSMIDLREPVSLDDIRDNIANLMADDEPGRPEILDEAA